MIAAIADDLTGAAEIAGLGWRHGLQVKIVRRDQPAIRTDLLVYDPDSRHCSAAEAARRVRAITRKLRSAAPVWVYKKVDSVLRGNVLVEVEAMRRCLGLERAIVVPANPGAGRVVSSGRYFVDGVPLHGTDFANDPTHPRTTDRVLELVAGPQAGTALSAGPRKRLLPRPVVIGDAVSLKDLDRWAIRVTDGTLAAGGGEFFAALLAHHGIPLRPYATDRPEPQSGATLFVWGSLSETCLRFVASSRSRDWPVFEMPHELLAGGKPTSTPLNRWARKTCAALQQHAKVLMTVGRAGIASPGCGARLETLLAEAAGRVVKQARVANLCVEGGSTAAALLQALRWSTLDVEREHARGVTAVRVNGVLETSVILKPGSYAWPRSVLA